MKQGERTVTGKPPPPHRSMRWWCLLLLAALVPLIGEVLGHPYFSSAGNLLAHHAFHAATVVLAAAIFGKLAADDIKRNGVPPRLQGLERLYRSLRGDHAAAADEGRAPTSAG